MATILPFETADARLERLSKKTPDEIAVLTPDERLKKYEEHTMTVCRNLLTYYKKTSQWTPACDTHMVTAVRSLKTLCRTLATQPLTNTEGTPS